MKKKCHLKIQKIPGDNFLKERVLLEEGRRPILCWKKNTLCTDRCAAWEWTADKRYVMCRALPLLDGQKQIIAEIDEADK